MNAPKILLSDSDFNNSLIDHGAYQGGYHLVKHPAVKTWGLRNQAGQVTFWDHAGRPFDTLSAVDAWLLIRRQEATDAARPVATPAVTRRRFLGSLATVAIATLTGSQLGHAVAAATEPEPTPAWDSDWGTDHPLDVYFRDKAIGLAIDPARAAIIDEWQKREDSLVGYCWALGEALDEVRKTKPADVDPVPVLNAIHDLQRFVDDLAADLEGQPAAELVEVCTGRPEFSAWIERCIRNGDTWGPADEMAPGEDAHRWLLEIDAVCRDHPEERSRLMAAYVDRFGAVKS